MEQKLHFVITRYCPMERIFDGYMTCSEAHRFMDENASFERIVGYKVFNDALCRWEDFKDSYHGGRRVYDRCGCLYILDPDYRSMHLPQSQVWHLWFLRFGGSRLFCQSFASAEQAIARRDFLSSDYKDGLYVVEPSDILIFD